jgi:hypothetical protein
MSQQRILVYGQLIETDDLPTAVTNLMSPGRLKGMNFSVSSVDAMYVSGGSCLLPDGIIVIENETKTLIVPTSSFAATYTIMYQLEDTTTLGGSPAILTLINGYLRQENLTNSTILGWINYPGGAVPLNASMFIQPSYVRVSPQIKEFDYRFNAPMASAIRTEGVVENNKTIPYKIPIADLGITSSTIVSVGTSARVISATILPTVDVLNDPANVYYAVIELKKGTDVLFSYDTRNPLVPIPNTIPPKSYGLVAGTQTALNKNTSLQAEYFVFTTEHLTLEITEHGDVPSQVAEIVLMLESPATLGTWKESTVLLSNEWVERWAYQGSGTLTIPVSYSLYFPFIISSTGQPRKLVSRLHVDFNCSVAFAILVGGNTIALGSVANTGSLLTREYNVPSSSSITWAAGKTAYIQVTITAEPSRGASFAYVGLTNEPTPFPLFA